MIYQTNGEPTLPAALSIDRGDEKEFQQLVDCATGLYIDAATEHSDVIGVFAKAEPGDSWTDIIADRLSIEAFSPERKTFYFKIEVDEAATLGPDQVEIRVGR